MYTQIPKKSMQKKHDSNNEIVQRRLLFPPLPAVPPAPISVGSQARTFRNSTFLNLKQLTNDTLKISTDDVQTNARVDLDAKIYPKAKGTQLLRNVIDSARSCTLSESQGGNSELDITPANAINGVGSDTIVRFNSGSRPDITTRQVGTSVAKKDKRPTWIGLAHELIHAERSMRGEAIDYADRVQTTYKILDEAGILRTITRQIPKEELATVGLEYHTVNDITENQIREEQKVEKRAAY